MARPSDARSDFENLSQNTVKTIKLNEVPEQMYYFECYLYDPDELDTEKTRMTTNQLQQLADLINDTLKKYLNLIVRDGTLTVKKDVEQAYNGRKP